MPEDVLIEAFATLYLRHKSDIDTFISRLHEAFRPHTGNPDASRLLGRFESALKIKALDGLAGPQLRNRFYSQIVDLGRLDLDLLIQGPSGCGKSSVVSAIHKNGRRAGKLLKEYNCTKGERVWNQLVTDVQSDSDLAGGVVWIDELQAFVPAVQQQYDVLRWPLERDIQVIAASSSDYGWLKRQLVHDFVGRYCMRVFEVGALRDRQLDFREFAIKHVSRSYNRIISTALIEKLRVHHEWEENHREVMGFFEELVKALPPKRVSITEALIAKHLGAFGEPVLMILRKIPEFSKRMPSV
jgi:DNA-binding NtrC family response regulator